MIESAPQPRPRYETLSIKLAPSPRPHRTASSSAPERDEEAAPVDVAAVLRAVSERIDDLLGDASSALPATATDEDHPVGPDDGVVASALAAPDRHTNDAAHRPIAVTGAAGAASFVCRSGAARALATTPSSGPTG